MEVGEVFHDTNNTIIWEVPSFSILPHNEGVRIWSPVFSYFDCGMCMLDIEWLTETPIGSVGLIFNSTDDKIPRKPTKRFGFGIVDDAGTVSCCSNYEWVRIHICFPSGYFRVQELTDENWLTRRSNPQDKFRLFCEIMNKNSRRRGNTSKEFENVPVMFPASKTVVDEDYEDNDLKYCNYASDEVCTQDLKRPDRLVQNLEDLFVSGKHSDVLIKVKDREFKVHKAILTARSSVFDRMFSYDLSETNSGVVPIEDCEPTVFEEFLYFVYTGRAQPLSSDNACDLYYVADKYDIPELKEECVILLMKSLSVETICDVICLATKCNESELLNFSITYFAQNMEEIIITVKWLLFLKENPVEANELTIKALKLGFTKRKV